MSVNTAGAVASEAIATGAIAASTSWIPVIGAAVMAVTIWISINARKNAQKSASTHIADDIEKKLEQNLDGYMHGPRTPESQAWALQNFDAAWAFLTSPQGCGNPELGSAGERCINERKPGANPPWAVCAPNCPNWFTLYRDPIANDTPHNSADQILQQLSVGSSGNLMRFAVFAVLVWAVMR